MKRDEASGASKRGPQNRTMVAAVADSDVAFSDLEVAIKPPDSGLPTRVNGVEARQVRLRPGDRIGVGSVVIVYGPHAMPAPAPAMPTPTWTATS